MYSFVIGTANFTQSYGSGTEPLERRVIISILEEALKWGLCELDTAEGYGDLNRTVPKSLLNEFTIRTKISVDDIINVDKTCNSIGARFKNVGSILIHNADELSPTKLVQSLEKIKECLPDSRVGVSIYDRTEILDLECIESLQVPFNILNNPLASIDERRIQDLDIIVRSVFLQGVLLNNRRFIISEDYRYIQEYINLLADFHGLNSKQFLLAQVKSKKLRPVLGFRNVGQFNEICSHFTNLPDLKSEYRIITKKNLYDPRKWLRK